MTVMMRIIGAFSVLAVALPSSSIGFAGTSRQKALAAVTVARATLEIADERPRLPDVGRDGTTPKSLQSSRSVSINAALRQNDSNDPLPHEAALPGKEAHTITAEPFAIQSIRIQPANAPVITDVLPAQIVVGRWERGCPACLRQERDVIAVLTPLKWTIGNGAENQIQFIHIPMTESAPQIRLHQNGVVIKIWQGYQDPAMLSRELRSAWDAAPSRLSSSTISGSAGTILARSQVRQLMIWWREHVGQGRQAKFNWDRTGADSFPLLAKGDWSVKALFGEAGRMDLSAPGASNLPINALGFAYRIVGPDVVFDADPVVIPGLATRLGPPALREATSATPVQFIDPLTAWSIFSMLRDLWELLHPTCDFQLGGTVSASAILSDDKFIVDFTDCPSIKLVALFTFQLKVRRIEITESTVRLIFSGSRLVKERTFEVQ